MTAPLEPKYPAIMATAKRKATQLRPHAPDLRRLTYREAAVLLRASGARQRIDEVEDELRRWCPTWAQSERIHWVELVARLIGTCDV